MKERKIKTLAEINAEQERRNERIACNIAGILVFGSMFALVIWKTFFMR